MAKQGACLWCGKNSKNKFCSLKCREAAEWEQNTLLEKFVDVHQIHKDDKVIVVIDNTKKKMKVISLDKNGLVLEDDKAGVTIGMSLGKANELLINYKMYQAKD